MTNYDDEWEKTPHQKGMPHSQMIRSGSFTYYGAPYYHEAECLALTDICEFEPKES